MAGITQFQRKFLEKKETTISSLVYVINFKVN